MAEAKAKGGGGLAATAIVVLLLTLVGAGAGFAVGFALQPDPAAETPAAKKPEPAAAVEGAAEANTAEGEGEAGSEPNAEAQTPEENTGEEVALNDLKLVPFPPVLTTLSEPKGRWIRLEGVILVKPGSTRTAEVLAEETGEQMLAYLRGLKLEQIEGPAGLQALKDDLNETARTLSGGAVRGILIHGLLVE